MLDTGRMVSGERGRSREKNMQRGNVRVGGAHATTTAQQGLAVVPTTRPPGGQLRCYVLHVKTLPSSRRKSGKQGFAAHSRTPQKSKHAHAITRPRLGTAIPKYLRHSPAAPRPGRTPDTCHDPRRRRSFGKHSRPQHRPTPSLALVFAHRLSASYLRRRQVAARPYPLIARLDSTPSHGASPLRTRRRHECVYRLFSTTARLTDNTDRRMGLRKAHDARRAAAETSARTRKDTARAGP